MCYEVEERTCNQSNILHSPVCARFNSLRYKKIKKVLITRKTKQNKTKTMPLCDELSPQTPDLPPVP